MNENLKTVTFVAVAAVVLLIAWASRPTLPVKEPGDVRGQRLFPDFNDPLAAASLEIVEFDEGTATVRPFQVAQARGRWSIPSHDNYPADAKDQMAEAAADVMGLKILEVASDATGDHALYGVVDPDPKTLQVGTTGVGTRVTMKDSAGKVLMSLITGKAVPDKPDLHYVRRVGQDQVYTVAVKTSRLSTKFEDWIEKDLLKMDVWDLKQLDSRDHSVDELNMALIQRGEMTLEYNDTGDSKWKMIEDRAFENGTWVPVKMADDEELNTSKLDELKSAVADLKIVDVRPKPKGLSADLKAAENFTNNREAVESLADRGFYVARVAGRVELFSNQGEIRCLMKNGVQYVLRFGEIALGTDTAKKKDDKKDQQQGEKKDEKTDQKKDSAKTGLNRYIFVTTEFVPEAIPKPQLEPLPEEKKPSEGEKAEAKKPQGEKPEAGKADSAEAKDKKAEGEKPDALKPESAEAKDNKAEGEKLPADKGQGANTEPPKAETPKPDAPKTETDQKNPAQKTEASQEGQKPDLKAERERIEKENKRKQEEYDEKVKKGQERVKELNARFADWYYVISDEVYRKTHVGRSDIVKKKEKDKDKDKDKDQDKGKTDAAGADQTSAKQPAPKQESNTPSEFEKLKEEVPGKDN